MFKNPSYKTDSFAPNLHNEHEALKARVLKLTPPVQGREMQLFRNWVKRYFHTLFPNFRKQRPVSIATYLRNSNASPSVKRTIQSAWDKLQEQGISWHSVLTPGQLHRMTKRKSFIKVENNLYFSPGGRLHKAPRLIQGAQPEFIALVGPAFMSIQAEIKRVWSKDFMVWFTSGAKSKELADYISEPNMRRWFENDVSAFDASVSEDLCQLEVYMAKRMGAPRAVLDLMRANIKTHGTTSHGIKYRCRGTRKSGDPYTSCFNSALNGLMHLYALSRGGDPRALYTKVRMLVQGDDNLLRHDRRLSPDWGVLGRLGFKCENIYRRGPEDSEFCSSRLYPVRDGYCFGPKLGRLLNKFLAFNNPPMGVSPMAVARGVALGLVAVATYVPLVAAMVVRVLQLTQGYTAYHEQVAEWKMSYSAQHMTTDTYAFVDSVYGLSSRGIRYAEEDISQISFGDSIDTPILRMLFDRDTAARQVIFC